MLIKLLMVGVCVTGLLSGCASTPKQIAYKTLVSVGVAGDTAANVLVQARIKGKLSDAQWDLARARYAEYQAAYRLACAQAVYSMDAKPSEIVVNVLNEWLLFVDSLTKKEAQ